MRSLHMSIPFSHVQICVRARIMMAAASQHPANKAACPTHIDICTQATEDSDMYCYAKRRQGIFRRDYFFKLFLFFCNKQMTVFRLTQTFYKKSNPTWTGVRDCGVYIVIMILSYIKCNCDTYSEILLFPIQDDYFTNSCPSITMLVNLAD